ncbi:MAG TPA: GDP-mannose 4,6-dehydratase, partial [Luteolibacter sp.]
MKILVTGGAGFIGSNLVHSLMRETSGLGLDIEKAVTLDKLTYAGNVANLEPVAADPRHLLIEGDICDGDLVAGILDKHDIDVVMHLAAESHVDRSIDSPEEFVVTNVLGTFRLLESFRQHLRNTGRTRASGYGKPLAKGGNCLFLQVSTDEVFGSLADGDAAFNEATPYSPNSPYSAS